MLIITGPEEPGPNRTVKVEGKLLGPWIEELRSACVRSRVTTGSVRLDLRGVDYIDVAGARVVASLIQNGASLVGCSGFVAAMLEVEELGGTEQADRSGCDCSLALESCVAYDSPGDRGQTRGDDRGDEACLRGGRR